MKSFVTGALGQLGQELRTLLPTDTVWTDRTANVDLGIEAVDITDQSVVQVAIEEANPDVIYHCAAYTNVDGAETDEAAARAVNIDGTKHVAQAAQAVGAKLVIISTDYVFDGERNRPYVETDEPNPLSVYGRTKLEAEEAALAVCDTTFVVRTAWLYGPSSTVAPVKNFPQTMRRLARERRMKSPLTPLSKRGELPPLQRGSEGDLPEIRVVNDQTGSPTFTKDLVAALIQLAETDEYGIWHVANSGQATWYDFARAILKDEIAAGKVVIKPIPTTDYPLPAKRPKYSALDTTVYSETFGPVRSWQAALAEYLKSVDPSR